MVVLNGVASGVILSCPPFDGIPPVVWAVFFALLTGGEASDVLYPGLVRLGPP
jgi:hypothetical protein